MTIQQQEKIVQLEWDKDFLLKKLKVNEMIMRQWQQDLVDCRIHCKCCEDKRTANVDDNKHHVLRKWWQFWK